MNKNNKLSAILFSILYYILFQATQAFPTFIISLKSSFEYLLPYIKNGETLTNDAILEILNEKILPDVLKWQYVILAISSLILIFIVLCISKFNKKMLGEKIGAKSFNLSHIPAFFAIGTTFYMIATALVSVISTFSDVYQSSSASYQELNEMMSSPASLVLTVVEIVTTVILAPVAEEILCRGLVQRTLGKAFSKGATILLTGLFFAYIHGNLYQFAYTLPFGIFLAYITEAFDSIFPAIFIHSAFNMSNFIMMIPQGFEGEMQTFLTFAILILFIFLVPVSVILIRKIVPKVDLKSNFGEAFYEETPEKNTAENYVNVKESDFMAPDFIVAGLGNPGKKYEGTRHNMGFCAIDYIGLRENFQSPREKFNGLVWEKSINGKNVMFIKPMTMMNNSGLSVGEAARFYKIPPEKVLIIYDDINFEPGKIRIKKNGSSGGHNGIKSIINCLSSEEFPRIKIGVGLLPENHDLVDWVLSRPSSSDTDLIVGKMESVYEAAKLIVSGDAESAQAKFNG